MLSSLPIISRKHLLIDLFRNLCSQILHTKFITLILVSCLIVNGSYAQLATYTGTGGTSTTVAGVPNETVSLLQWTGFGTNTPCGSGGKSGITVSTAWSSYNPSGPRVFIKITPNTGYQLNVTGFSAITRESGTGPTKARLAYSLDNGISWVDEGADHPQTVGASCGAASNVFSWFGTLTVTGITSTTNGIIVAIYPHTPGGSTGTFQVNSIVIGGNVTCAPPAAITGTMSFCQGTTTALSSATSAGTWSSSDPSVAAVGSGSGIVTGVSAGVATITYTTLPGCYATAAVTVNPSPSTITGTLNVCVGATTPLTATGGGSWSTASGNASVDAVGVVTGISAGTAVITYTLPGGCFSTATVTVDPLPVPVTGGMNVCVGSSTTLVSSGSGIWSSGSTGIVVIGSASGIVTGVSAGTSTVTYSFSSGCSVYASVTVDPVPSAISGVASVCVGAATTLTTTTAGGTWSSSNTAIATVGSTSGVVGGVAAGIANITYTLATGCYATSTVTVNPLPSGIAGLPYVCAGTTTILTAPGGGTWSSSDVSVATVGSASGAVTGITAGGVTITYTLPTGCEATTLMTVNPLPAAISGPSVICPGASILLSSSGAGTWQSSSPAIATVGSSTGTVTGIVPGIVTIRYTLSSTGCSIARVVTVHPSPAIFNTFGGGGYCLGDTGVHIWLSGSAAGVLYQLYNGAATTGVPVAGTGSVLDFGLFTTAGTYTIIATNGFGCTAPMTGIAVVSVNPLPALYAVTGGGNYCAGGTGVTIGLSGSSAGINYQLFNGATATGLPVAGTGSSISFGLHTTAGTYTVSATNSITGCSRTMTGSAVVSVNTLPSPVSGPSSVCIGSTITLANTGGGTWVSSTPSIATVGATTGVVTGITNGTATITYTLPVTTCYVTKVVTVSVSPVAISGPSKVCTSMSITLSNPVPGGIWTSSSTLTATIGSLSGVVAGITPGTTVVSYSLGSGCTVTRTVTVDPSPGAIAGSTVICAGNSTLLSNPTPGGTWISSGVSVATIGSVTGVVSGLSAGSTTISYVIPNGCVANISVSVTPVPSSILGTLKVCAGSTTTLSCAVGGGIWTSSNSSIATIGSSSGIVSGVATGTAVITYSVGSGCIVTRIVTVNPVPAAVTGTPFMCIGLSTALADVTPGGLWSSSNPVVAAVGTLSGIVNGLSAGTSNISYTVVATGCASVMTVTVNAAPPAIAGSGNVCFAQTITVSNSIPGGVWSSGNPAIASVGSGTGVVTGLALGSATIFYSIGGCVVAAPVVVIAGPAPITASSFSVCAGSNITLSNSSPGGTWSSNNIPVATVGSGTGIVSGVSSGTAIISYTLGTTGCSSIAPVAVSAVLPILGAPSVCVGQTITLTNAIPGGAWSSSNAAVASVSGGVVAGITAGVSTISYVLSSTGCISLKQITVDPLPLPIGGAGQVCAGKSVTLTNATPGGSWSSGNPAVAAVGVTGIVSGVSAGSVTITYSLATGCFVTRLLTVHPLPATITGTGNLCVGSSATLSSADPGGIWSTTTPAISGVGSLSGIVTGISSGVSVISYTLGTGCAIHTLLTINSNPPTITGAATVCIGSTVTLTNTVPGGTWSSSNPAVADVGIATGIVTGMASGAVMVTYTLSTGCLNTKTVTVHSLPAAISGNMTVCTGSTETLSSASPGGTWGSSNPAIATIGSASGIATGIAAGVTLITYTLGTGCSVSASFSVNPLPMPIIGTSYVCTGLTTNLYNLTPGGDWSSSDTAIVTIDASGIITGISAGTALISYTLSATTGCSRTLSVNVYPMPTAISGPANVCLAATVPYVNSVPGGSWSSFNPTVATVGSSSGNVTGVSVGAATIIYQFPGCSVSKIVNVIPLPLTFTVTGGGSHCAGDTGVHIKLSGSTVGVNYMLYLGATPVGAFPGTGSSLDFGLHTVAGVYTVKAINTATTCTVAMAGSAVVGAIPSVTPVVNLNVTPNDTLCAGATATFTPVPVNGGLAPLYTWRVNGIPVSVSGSYSFIPGDGDIVTVAMVSNAICPSPATVSRSVTMEVQPFSHPSVSVALLPNDTVCKGTLVTANAVTNYAGSSPAFTWYKNGTIVSYSGSDHSFTANHGDEIFCVLTSNHPCRLSTVDSSARVRETVMDPVLPIVTINASPGTTISKGERDTLTAIVDKAVNPTYQWYINGFPVSGATNATFINAAYNFPQQDSVSCAVTSHDVCEVTTHKWVYIKVTTQGVGQLNNDHGIRISPNPNAGIFTVTGAWNLLLSGDADICVTNMLGQIVYMDKCVISGGRLSKEVRLGEVANGMYLLSVRSNDQGAIFHIVVGK